MKKLRVILIILALLGAAAWYIVYSNTNCGVTNYTVSSARIPAEFNGFKILQVSDLHDALIGDDNADLIRLAREANPDIIVITGDIIDTNRLNIDRSVSVAGRLAAIAPVYYVTGNHEASLTYNTMRTLRKGLEEAGVTVLEDRALYVEGEYSHIQIAGLSDIGFYFKGDMQATREELLSRAAFMLDESVYTVLLSHRPELIDTYLKTGADLVLAGHAHGGQVRVPFIGGLYSPGQGTLPKYDNGVYAFDALTMIVSRGIGNSKFPLRVNNNPELVLITLKAIQH